MTVFSNKLTFGQGTSLSIIPSKCPCDFAYEMWGPNSHMHGAPVAVQVACG